MRLVDDKRSQKLVRFSINSHAYIILLYEEETASEMLRFCHSILRPIGLCGLLHLSPPSLTLSFSVSLFVRDVDRLGALSICQRRARARAYEYISIPPAAHMVVN